MAKKYIDADLLKKEIESLKSLEYPCDNSEQNLGFENALDRVSDIIDSLQQEQPSEDLKKEFNQWLRGVEKRYGGDLPYYGEYGLFCVARHFYELGKKSK